MNVKGSLEDAWHNEYRLKNAAWKCYSGLSDKSTDYAKRVLFLHNCHEQVVDIYQHFIGDWEFKEKEDGRDNRQPPQRPNSAVGSSCDESHGQDHIDLQQQINSMDKRFSEADKGQIKTNTELFDRLKSMKKRLDRHDDRVTQLEKDRDRHSKAEDRIRKAEKRVLTLNELWLPSDQKNR